MKKLLIITSAVCLGFTACQKETLTQNEEHNNPGFVPIMDVNKYKINATILQGGDCDGAAVNCRILPEVIVTPRQNDIFGNSGSFSRSYVSAFVANPENANLFDALHDDIKEMFLAGQYGMAVHHNSDNSLVLIFGPSDNVTFENLEFGMQYAK